MYSPALINDIHKRLAATLPQALVLLGGSYWYNEAREESDLDFYCVVPWFKVRQTQRLALSVVSGYQNVKLSVMIVPRLFFQRGWYYIDGVDLEGKRHTSPLNKMIVIRNCLKLAWWHYLGSLIATNAGKQAERLSKARHQLAVAIELLDGRIPEPLWSRRALAPALARLQSQDLRTRLAAATNQARPHLSFSLANYLIYNLKFLLRGRGLFLFQNPDKMILNKIRFGLQPGADLIKLEPAIRQIVFPVIIVERKTHIA